MQRAGYHPIKPNITDASMIPSQAELAAANQVDPESAADIDDDSPEPSKKKKWINTIVFWSAVIVAVCLIIIAAYYLWKQINEDGGCSFSTPPTHSKPTIPIAPAAPATPAALTNNPPTQPPAKTPFSLASLKKYIKRPTTPATNNTGCNMQPTTTTTQPSIADRQPQMDTIPEEKAAASVPKTQQPVVAKIDDPQDTFTQYAMENMGDPQHTQPNNISSMVDAELDQKIEQPIKDQQQQQPRAEHNVVGGLVPNEPDDDTDSIASATSAVSIASTESIRAMCDFVLVAGKRRGQECERRCDREQSRCKRHINK